MSSRKRDGIPEEAEIPPRLEKDEYFSEITLCISGRYPKRADKVGEAGCSFSPRGSACQEMQSTHSLSVPGGAREGRLSVGQWAHKWSQWSLSCSIRHPGDEDEQTRWACRTRKQRGPVKIASGPAPVVLRLRRTWLPASTRGGIFLFPPFLLLTKKKLIKQNKINTRIKYEQILTINSRDVNSRKKEGEL